MRRVVKMIGNQGSVFALSVLCFLATACGSIARQPGSEVMRDTVRGSHRGDGTTLPRGRDRKPFDFVCRDPGDKLSVLELILKKTGTGTETVQSERYTFKITTDNGSVNSVELSVRATGDKLNLVLTDKKTLDATLTTDEAPQNPSKPSQTPRVGLPNTLQSPSNDRATYSFNTDNSIDVKIETDEGDVIQIICN